MAARAIPSGFRRRQSALVGPGCRVCLRVELLEDRLPPAASPGCDVVELARGQPYTRTEVVASVRSDQPLADLTGAVRALRGTLAGEINPSALRRLFGRGGTSVVKVGLADGADPLQAVRDLDALPFVAWASPNFVYNPPGSPAPGDFDPDDPRYPQQYQHPLIQDDLAWDTTLGDPRVVIAVTDDGVDLDHEDLYQNIWINQGEIPASRRQNLVDVDGDGVISFTDLNDPANQGPFKITDINGDGRIDAADLLAPMDRDGNGNDRGTGGWATGQDKDGNGYVDDLVGWNTINGNNNPNPTIPIFQQYHGTHVAGIAAARTNNGVGVAGVAGGATIMPIRFFDYGMGDWTSAVIAESFAYATDNGARIVNTSYTWDDMVDDPTMRAGLQYMYDGGVLHINSAGNNMRANPPRQAVDTTLFVANTDANDHKAASSNWGWGVDLSAPGQGIVSTYPNGDYITQSGTSMSAPEVAGVAALIWSVHPDWTRDQVAAQLLGTADAIDGLNPAYAGQLGTGRVNAYRALTETIAAPRLRDVLGLPADGGSTTQPVRSFQVDLASVFDPATVNDPANWELFQIRPGGRTVPIPLTYTNTLGGPYLIGTNRLYFTPVYPLTHGTFQFRAVAGGLTDPFGTALDGDGRGTPGQDFVLNFTVRGAVDSAGVDGAPDQWVSLAAPLLFPPTMPPRLPAPSVSSRPAAGTDWATAAAAIGIRDAGTTAAHPVDRFPGRSAARPPHAPAPSFVAQGCIPASEFGA